MFCNQMHCASVGANGCGGCGFSCSLACRMKAEKFLMRCSLLAFAIFRLYRTVLSFVMAREWYLLYCPIYDRPQLFCAHCIAAEIIIRQHAHGNCHTRRVLVLLDLFHDCDRDTVRG